MHSTYDVHVSRQRLSVIYIHMWMPFQYYGWLFIKKATTVYDSITLEKIKHTTKKKKTKIK